MLELGIMSLADSIWPECRDIQNVGFEVDMLSFFPEQFCYFGVYNQPSKPPMSYKSVETISIIDFSHLCKTAGTAINTFAFCHF